MSIRRQNLAFRYMWTAWLNVIRWLTLLGLLVFLGIALAKKEPSWLLPAGISGGIFLLALALFLLESPSVRCLGCGGTLLRPMRCAKHKSAKRILGSYTLPCTLVLATYAKSVHCPYCGMRYRISRRTHAKHRRADEVAAEQSRAEAAAREAEARAESEKKKMPYY